MAKKVLYKLADFKHRVAICSMHDIVESAGVMSLKRTDVYHCWAKITPVRGSMFSAPGYAIQENRNNRSHLIAIRVRYDIDFTSSAWIYEERIQSPSRWYKILDGVNAYESGEYFEISARLIEQGAAVLPPSDSTADCAPVLGATPLPKGVRL